MIEDLSPTQELKILNWPFESGLEDWLVYNETRRVSKKPGEFRRDQYMIPSILRRRSRLWQR